MHAAGTVSFRAPLVSDERITFIYNDASGQVDTVDLLQEVARPRVGPRFERSEDGSFRLEWPRPDADRVEYQLLLNYADGGSETIADPANPLVAEGPFGYRSVVELPGYAAPPWVERTTDGIGRTRDVAIRSRILRCEVPVTIWEPAEVSPDDQLPILFAHDGPEYARYSGLTKMLEVLYADRRIPRLRAALVPPVVDRDQIYSASAAYSRAFSHEILPGVEAAAPAPHGRRARIGMGASLGALAMLHVHRSNPATFGALFLQSGSFFRQRFDKQESGFVRFRRISRFVGTVLVGSQWPHPVRVVMTCGTIEENLANNKAVARAMKEQGYDVDLHVNRDAHNWVAWRDTFDPHLSGLMNEMWSADARAEQTVSS
ncbi:MAG: alpha/beta hydrolase-fold protein [Actinomycetota bacterium]|nr:alpha/beta hydrolase-fold protein [Actinomycetota bacterium]